MGALPWEKCNCGAKVSLGLLYEIYRGWRLIGEHHLTEAQFYRLSSKGYTIFMKGL